MCASLHQSGPTFLLHLSLSLQWQLSMLRLLRDAGISGSIWIRFALDIFNDRREVRLAISCGKHCKWEASRTTISWRAWRLRRSHSSGKSVSSGPPKIWSPFTVVMLLNGSLSKIDGWSISSSPSSKAQPDRSAPSTDWSDESWTSLLQPVIAKNASELSPWIPSSDTSSLQS